MNAQLFSAHVNVDLCMIFTWSDLLKRSILRQPISGPETQLVVNAVSPMSLLTGPDQKLSTQILPTEFQTQKNDSSNALLCDRIAGPMHTLSLEDAAVKSSLFSSSEAVLADTSLDTYIPQPSRLVRVTAAQVPLRQTLGNGNFVYRIDLTSNIFSPGVAKQCIPCFGLNEKKFKI